MPAASECKNCDISAKSLLHFCIFLANPNFDNKTDYIFSKPIKSHFNDILSTWKYSQLLNAQVEYISVIKISHSKQQD